ncbi:hypothetical protein RRG08_058291 [Elysia crispata]|uniref:CCHC-type domain-containing protein n=1 Tax=Elysia crispata TaxID=231223 RepID=A0AAE1D687_9GAST|nr:hypothetical protein RRG08_058291 [Elysia crispata]
MVKKDDLFDWFKNLQPRKRLDYMCTLLHMCLPLELRFIGSVLEDLARKDFHHLRDAEIKANQRNDLSNNPTNNIDDPHLRNKISIALALMNSTNSSCADIIFGILENQVDALLQLLRYKDVADQISLILTMAVYHPAFKFYQRNRLGEILQLVVDKMKEQYGDEDKTSFHIKQPLTQEQHGSMSSCATDVSGKVTLKAIEIVKAREDQSSKRSGLKSQREDSLGRRGNLEFEFHTTWSNGEVTQIFMKYKQFQELHHKVLNKFPEEKEKKQRTIPHFPGYSLRSEPLQAQIDSLNSYLSQLTKTPPHILECDILHTALRNGPVIRCLPPQQASLPPAMKNSSTLSPQSGFQTVCTQASPLYEDYHPNAMSSNSTNSPANSRTSSPGPAPLMGGKANLLLPTTGRGFGGTVTSLSSQQHQGSNIEISLNQLLCLLNLDSYSDNLKEFSFKQILSMSIEDYSKAGLPVDAQVKLRTKLDELKLTSAQGRNGIIPKPPGLPSLPQHQSQQLPPPASVTEAAAAAYQYPYVQLSPGQLTYLGPPGSSFAHPPHPHHILPYSPLAAAAMGQNPAMFAASLMPPSSSASNNQHQQMPLLPLSSMTSQFQQDLLASPDFPNSETSSPPNSPHLGQEPPHHQPHASCSTSGGSSSSSCDGTTGGQVGPALLPLVSSASSHSVVGQSQQVPGPLPMMSPPAAVAADTLALSDVKQLKGMSHQQIHGLDESILDEEDIRPGYQDIGNSSKVKVVNQYSVPTVAGNIPMIANALSGVSSSEEPVMSMSGAPTPVMPADILLRTDGTPTPPLPPTVLSVSSQSSVVLANGYMTDPSIPLPPSNVIGRALHTLPRAISGLGGYKVAAQPTHTTPGLQNVIKMPGLDHGSIGTKNGNNGAGAGVNGNNPGLIPHPTPAIPPHHHSYMPPPVAGPPHQSNNNGNNSNIITSSSGASTGNSQLISQPPPAPLPHVDGNYQPALYPLMFAAPTVAHAASQHHQLRGILTSVAGSTNVINTTQSHSSGHTSTPRCCDVSGGGVYKMNAGDALPAEPLSSSDRHGSPTSQTPHQQVESVKAQSHPSGQHSSTPSPPLVPSSGTMKAPIMPAGGVLASSPMLGAGNEPGPVGIRNSAGGAQQMVQYCIFVNGMVPHYIPHHPHPSQQPGGHHSQPPPPPAPAFPNGLGPGAPTPSHDPFLRSIAAAPQFTAGGQVPPNFYGNSVYPPPHHHNSHHLQQQQHHHPNNSNSHQGRNTNSPAGAGNSSASSQLQGKGVCYNCGQPGHRAADCKESTMENMSNSYRLSFEPKADPQ